jgi:competence protein ComEC
LIYLALEKICSRPVLVTAIMIILLLYNFILGPRASVMRSTIWVISAAAAGSWDREFRSSYIICISFILMIILNPVFICDAGFWLSFSAMAGIIFIYPVLRDSLRTVKLHRKIIDSHVARTILVTVSIQLICGPLLIHYFSSLPLISPVSNLIIFPFFYILLLLLFLAAFTSIIWPPAGGILLKLTPALFRCVYGITGFFSHSRLPSLTIEKLSGGHLLIYYFIVFILFLIIRIILGSHAKDLIFKYK